MEEISCKVIGKEVRGCLYLKGKTIEKNPTCLRCPYFKKLKERNIDLDKIRKDGCYWVSEEVFTWIPPEGDLAESFLKSQAYIPRSRVPFDEFAYMKLPIEQFAKTKNPIYGFQAFIAAVECGYYPSFSILSWLVEVFKKYLDSDGAPGIFEKLLGIIGKQKQGNAFKRIRRTERDLRLMIEIFKLTKTGMKPKEAAQRVAKSGKLNTEGLASTTLQNRYSQMRDEMEDIFKKTI